MTRKWLWPLLTLLGPVAALVAIWGPLLAQYHVEGEQADVQHVEAARQPIPPVIRDRLMLRSGGLPVAAEPGRAAEKAERLIETGRLELGDFGEQTIELPFAPANLRKGTVTWQLQVAALVVPRLFMDAYRESGEQRYLEWARESVLAWARFEGAQWLPMGLLWNDHALAVRIEVLARFWQLYREHPNLLSDTQAGEVLGFVSRSLQLTAKPALYTPRTNHGLFQNLALWLGHQAFPGLPSAKRAAEVAYERFQQHLPYYMGPDGVVLEHSAGYHAVGLSLVGRAFWYMDLAGQSIPESSWRRYQDAIAFYRVLRRPDGSLPRVGDTHAREGGSVRVARRMGTGGVELVPLEVNQPAKQMSVYPVSGYAIDWRKEPAGGDGLRQGQTVLAWSNFPMAGHKHADELSLHFWSGGVDWWTGVGYWPYGHRDRHLAESWTEGNAPHFVGEAADSERDAELLGQLVQPDGARFIDLGRSGAGYTIRRQYLSLPDGTRVVLDSARDEQGRPTEAVWRTAPTVRVQPLGEGAFRLREADSGEMLGAWFGGAGSLRRVRGRAAEGIRGMAMDTDQQQPEATTSLVVRRPSDGEPSYAVWRSTPGKGDPQMMSWDGPDAWDLRIPGDGGQWEVRRDAGVLSLRGPSGTESQVHIEEGPPIDAARGQIVEAYDAARAEFAGVRPLIPYRIKTTWVGVALLVAHGAGLLVLPFILGNLRRASITVLAGWAVYILWLRFYYFP